MTAQAQPTPLARLLAERIARDGPMSIRDYMDACLHDPEHGYYRTRRAIGAQEDFITAPEISQVFGELIGLWAVVVWQQMGSPGRLRLVEIGPGRGTLMRDALRAVRVVPEFLAALDVVLVEPNGALQAVQRKMLDGCGAPLRWCADLARAADGAARDATVVIANEVLDVIPITQLVRTDTGWAERVVGMSEGENLTFGVQAFSAKPPDVAAQPGQIVEYRDTRALAAQLRRLADAGPFAGLFMDYGYDGPAVGDTLQAIRAQRFEDPLASPGTADLTAHVDFAAFAADVRAAGLAVDGPGIQAAFLGTLGIVERTSRLMAANPEAAAALEAATVRLIAPTGMGTRFKAISVRSPELAPLPGF